MSISSGGYPVRVRTQVVTRALNVGAGVVLTLGGIAIALSPLLLHVDPSVNYLSLSFAVPAVFFGGMFLLRGNQVGAVLYDDSVRVINFFKTTTIERSRITDVTNQPTIVWTDVAGKTRRTAISGLKVSDGVNFNIDAQLPSSNPISRAINTIRQWAQHPEWKPNAD
jgi:hypothetical protein